MTKAEKFIEDYTRNCSNVSKGYRSKGMSIPSYCIPWLTPEQARRAVEIERDELIDKAVEWIEDNLLTANQLDNGYINKFRKAMEE